jgi:AcrR family transcriptional regulator
MCSEAPETDKQKIIAQAAFGVFAAHGFRKTSMQRIADSADMSRPALYLHFQSKEDVFAFLVQNYFTQVADSITELLAASGPPVQVLSDMFGAWDPGGIKQVLLDAEHGHELMEVSGKSVTPDLINIELRIRNALTDWLAREAAAGHILCEDPETTSQTIMSSYKGLATPPPSYAVYKARTAQLALMIGRGLSL